MRTLNTVFLSRCILAVVALAGFSSSEADGQNPIVCENEAQPILRVMQDIVDVGVNYSATDEQRLRTELWTQELSGHADAFNKCLVQQKIANNRTSKTSLAILSRANTVTHQLRDMLDSWAKDLDRYESLLRKVRDGASESILISELGYDAWIADQE